MTEQQTAIYLTCTQNRGFQKKHIDVCKKCPSNDGCKEFQDYRQRNPLTPGPDHPIPKPAEIHRVEMIKQLTEIRKLLDTGESTPVQRHPTRTGSMASTSLWQYLKMELEGIKSMCSRAH